MNVTTKCAACERDLYANNTNPDNLCGKCQAYLKPGQPRYAEWKVRGKPSLKEMLKMVPVKSQHRRTKAERLADKRAEREAAKVAGEATAEVAGNHVKVTGLPPVDRLPLDYLAAAVAEFRFRSEQALKISALAKRLKV